MEGALLQYVSIKTSSLSGAPKMNMCALVSLQVLSVALAARTQVSTNTWQGEGRQAVHTLIDSLAKSRSAVDRRVGVEMLLALGAKEAWKQPEREATQVRKDAPDGKHSETYWAATQEVFIA